MPITINDGGVLRQLSKVSTNDGGILKPIYGTPKDNLTLHWGGFTGESHYDSDFLIGEFTSDGATYVNFSCNKNDTVSDNYKVSSKIIDGFSGNVYDGSNFLQFSTYVCVSYKTEKSINIKSYYKKYDVVITRSFKKNSSGAWEIYNDEFITNNGKFVSPTTTLDEGFYYVYTRKYAKLSHLKELNGAHYGSDGHIPIYELSGMEINLDFNFQTLNGG